MGKRLKVNLTSDYFKKAVYWIICKYNMDEFKREQSSSKQALLGGFIDRWLNRVPEFIIFNDLLKDKDYTVVTDKFFYTTSESKNAPDILGLVDDNENVYPFAKFKDDKWITNDEMPFIEMKTFRNTQKLISIPNSQFDENHYYALVESHVNDDYLLFLFDDDFFEDEKYYNNVMDTKRDEFIISNNSGAIKEPKEIELNDEIGYYELLGIYKGKELKKYSISVEQNDRPKYFSDIVNHPSRTIKKNLVDPNEYLKAGLYYFDNDKSNVPCYIEIGENSEIKIFYKTKNTISVDVKGEVKIDGIQLPEGISRLEFKVFEKNGSAGERIMTKSIIESFDKDISATSELIEKFDQIINN